MHTDASLLGAIAAEADWRRLVRRSAGDAGRGGEVVLGTDLLSIPVGC